MKIISILLLTLSLSPLFARSPAVDPVKELSYEEFNETKSDPGFAFQDTDSAYSNSHKNTELSFSTAFFLIIASSLPFIVWFGVMRALPDATPASATTAAKPGLSLVESQVQDDHSDDDHHLPKAS